MLQNTVKDFPNVNFHLFGVVILPNNDIIGAQELYGGIKILEEIFATETP